MVACICHSPLHHQKPDFEGQSVIKASSYLLPFVLEAHRESLPRSCETSARRLSAESAEVYSTADLPASAAHIPLLSSISPGKVERLMFLRLNRLSIPEVKALHDAIEANKAAAARCKKKVAQVEGAMANTALVLNLQICSFVVYIIDFF